MIVLCAAPEIIYITRRREHREKQMFGKLKVAMIT
jgi:hypothetical protein